MGWGLGGNLMRCADPTQSSETVTVWGLRWLNLPGERKGVAGGKDRTDWENKGLKW